MLTQKEVDRHKQDWVGFQHYLIRKTLEADFPLECKCVDWATMRLALISSPDKDWSSFWERVVQKDTFSLEELRSVLP